MAEFQEVMKQWRRMCKMYRTDCMRFCPICVTTLCGELGEVSDEDICKGEAVIMQWAAEHPEPEYPTWWEYLRAYSVTGANIPDSAVIYKLKNWEIPADIAQKLGIKPKEDIC